MPVLSDSLSSSKPTVSIIIVSYNTRELTLRCLQELIDDLEQEELSAELWVVDNASHDGSARAIAERFDNVHLIALPENIGFGPANNRAFEKASGDFFLLINSDAFVHRGAVSQMVDFLRDHPQAGIVGPRLLNEDGSLQISCWKFPTPARSWLDALGVARLFSEHPLLGNYFRWGHDQERSVDFVIGACLLVRREVYEQVGGFDESFFLYAEETDWQKRIRATDWDIVFIPDAEVTHLGGASGAAESGRISTLFWEGQERYIIKHHGRSGWGIMRSALLVGAFARVIGFVFLSIIYKKRKSALPRLRFSLLQIWRLLSTSPPSRKAPPRFS